MKNITNIHTHEKTFISMSTQTFHAAYNAWEAAALLRERRRRFLNYTYGDQWGDPCRDSKGKICGTEGDAIRNSGRNPLTNNLIRRLVKVIIGRWHSMPLAEEIYSSAADLADDNALPELDARLLEEFLISGVAIQRIDSDCRGRAQICNVPVTDFFINRHTDPRGHDVELIGMLHSLPLHEVVRRFCKGEARRATQLRAVYDRINCDSAATMLPLGGEASADSRFFTADDVGAVHPRCRVIEVWSRRSADVLLCHDLKDARAYAAPACEQKKIDAENRRRRRRGQPRINTRFSVQTVWYYHFFAPDGTVIDEGVSGYAHRSHPFVFKLFPLTDGEVHPFVEGLVDQQRYINRLIVSIDHTMQTSAKGVLLFPEQQLVDGWTLADVAREWSACDGIIPIRGNGVDGEPRQVVANGGDTQAYRLLDIQMKLFDQISGVPEALLGNTAASRNTGAELYNAQVENATANLTDIFRTFAALLHTRNTKAQNLHSISETTKTL